jgi:hypothetical protein
MTILTAYCYSCHFKIKTIGAGTLRFYVLSDGDVRSVRSILFKFFKVIFENNYFRHIPILFCESKISSVFYRKYNKMNFPNSLFY